MSGIAGIAGKYSLKSLKRGISITTKSEKGCFVFLWTNPENMLLLSYWHAI